MTNKQEQTQATQPAALAGVDRAVQEKVAAMQAAAASITQPKKTTLQDQVQAVMAHLSAIEDKAGYQLRPTVKRGNGVVEINTSLSVIDHKTINGQDIQSARSMPTLVITEEGVSLKTYGPGTSSTSAPMTLEEALDAVTPEKYKATAEEASKSRLEKETAEMLEGLAVLQKAVPGFQFNQVADREAARVKIETNVAAANEVIVREGVSFVYSKEAGNAIPKTNSAGSVAEMLEKVGYQAARQFKIGG